MFEDEDNIEIDSVNYKKFALIGTGTTGEVYIVV